MTDQENINLGSSLGMYVAASIVAAGQNDPVLWGRLQTLFAGNIEKATGIPAEDFAASVQKMMDKLIEDMGKAA